MNIRTFELILNHYTNVWKSNPSFYLWDKGPIEKLPSDFRVLEFPPTSLRKMWTYATCGMSLDTKSSLVELHIFSSVQDTGIVELLTSLVYYHHNTSSLGLNHTVNFGRSWQDQSICKHGFISLPYLDGSELEKLILSEANKEINFYWLIPITEDEVKYKSKYGIEALEQKFDEGFNYLDPCRKSLVNSISK